MGALYCRLYLYSDLKQHSEFEQYINSFCYSYLHFCTYNVPFGNTNLFEHILCIHEVLVFSLDDSISYTLIFVLWKLESVVKLALFFGCHDIATVRRINFYCSGRRCCSIYLRMGFLPAF